MWLTEEVGRCSREAVAVPLAPRRRSTSLGGGCSSSGGHGAVRNDAVATGGSSASAGLSCPGPACGRRGARASADRLVCKQKRVIGVLRGKVGALERRLQSFVTDPNDAVEVTALEAAAQVRLHAQHCAKLGVPVRSATIAAVLTGVSWPGIAT